MNNWSVFLTGSPQHLKNKYGEGYHVTVRLAGGTSPDAALLLDAMDKAFGSSCRILESSPMMAQYHIASDISVSQLIHCIKLTSCIIRLFVCYRG